MRLIRNLLAVFLLCGAPAFAQNQGEIVLPLYAQNVTPIGKATIGIVGNAGSATYYYWIVSQFSFGPSQPMGPFVAISAPTALSSSTYVTISPNWSNNTGGVTTADVLRTTSNVPPSGACNCAVATSVSPGSSVSDQSASLNSYTVATGVNPTNFSYSISNEVVGAGATHLILRQPANQTQIGDLNSVANGLTDPGGNGIIKRTAPNTTAPAALADFVSIGATWPLYTPNGTQVTLAPFKWVTTNTNLSGGTIAITFTGAAIFTANPICWAIDLAAANPVAVTASSGTGATVVGTGTDAVRLFCVGQGP